MWLIAISVALASYLYRINILLTVALVTLCSLFLGLFVFVLVTEPELHELDDAAGVSPDQTTPNP